jgi:hypothetical protein
MSLHRTCVRALSCAVCGFAVASAAAVDWTEATFGDQPVAIGAGPRALGMGGAFSAVADDATASTWNPAGLTQCERPELAASLGWYHAAIDAGDDQRASRAVLRPEHLSAMAPFFALGCQQVIGVAWQRRFDFTSKHALVQNLVDDSDPGGIVFASSDDETVRREGSFATFGVSYAIEPTPGLSVGITINQWADVWTRASHYQRDIHSESYSAATLLGFELFSERRHIDTSAETRVLSGTSLTLGTWWQATPALTLAVVVQPGYSLALETQTDTAQFVDDGLTQATTSTRTTSRSDLHHPPSVTLGSAWRHGDLTTISCDATWTRWRQFYIDEGGQRRSPISSLLDPEDFRDLWTLRAGFERILILPDMVLVPRCGALAEWLPAASAAPSLSAVEQTSATSDLWLGATTGISLCQRSTIWDAAVQVRRGDNIGAGQFANPDRTADVTVITMRLGVTLQF